MCKELKNIRGVNKIQFVNVTMIRKSKIKLYRPKQRKILCPTTFDKKGNNLERFLILPVISVHNINRKESVLTVC